MVRQVTLIDSLISFFYVLVFIGLIQFFSPKSNEPHVRYFKLFFYSKIFYGIVFVLIHSYYYPGGDTFYTESQTMKFSVLFTQAFFHESVLAKSSVLKENNYSEEYKHSKDFELCNRLSAKNYKLTNLKEALYVYRVNPHGVSKKIESVQIESHNNASAIYMGLFLNMKIDPSIVAFLNNRPTAISIKNIKLAKQLCKKLKTLLLENETIESNNYYHNHLLNVYLQALKFVSNKITKIYLVKQIFSILFKSNNLAYLRKKLNR